MTLQEIQKVFADQPELVRTMENSLVKLYKPIHVDSLLAMIETNAKIPLQESSMEVMYMRMMLTALYYASKQPIEVHVEIVD